MTFPYRLQKKTNEYQLTYFYTHHPTITYHTKIRQLGTNETRTTSSQGIMDLNVQKQVKISWFLKKLRLLHHSN